MCGAACIPIKAVTRRSLIACDRAVKLQMFDKASLNITPLLELSCSSTITLKIQMCEGKGTPPVGDRGSERKRHASTQRRKHRYILIQSLENNRSKCHLGSSFQIYKLAGSCLLSQHPCSAKLQHLQGFHFMPQLHNYFCKWRFINQARLLFTANALRRNGVKRSSCAANSPAWVRLSHGCASHLSLRISSQLV